MLEFHKDEKIIMYIRRHWFWILLETTGVFLIFIFPIFFIWLLQHLLNLSQINIFGVTLSYISDILIFIWAVFSWIYLAERFTKYALNFWILTNKRIIESELPKLFDRRLSTLGLEEIEDISVEVNGIIENLIGWGTLEVQTAGTNREFLAKDILNPVGVQKAIFDAKLALKQEEKDIERGEVEQITRRVMNGTNIIPQEQNYDWGKGVENTLRSE